MNKAFIESVASITDEVKNTLNRMKDDPGCVPDIEIDLLSQQLVSLYGMLQKLKSKNILSNRDRKEAGQENLSSSDEKISTSQREEIDFLERIEKEPASENQVNTPEIKQERPQTTQQIDAAIEDPFVKPEGEKEPVTVSTLQHPEDVQLPEERQEEKPENLREVSQQELQEAKIEAKEQLSEKKPLYEKLSESRVSLNERLNKQKMDISGKLQAAPISDLKSAISLNKKIAFINELFGGDQKEYRQVIDFISSCGNYSEAKYYVQSELKNKHNWQESDKLVLEFMDLIKRKFL
jgi:hypothetical protein